MKGVIDTELDEVTFKTLKGPLIVKMGQLPGKEYEVETTNEEIRAETMFSDF